MPEENKFLKLKERMNKKRPNFIRDESWRLIRVKKSWRRSKGIDSRVRRKEKGVIKSPNVGYRTPRKLRGLHPRGYKEVLVYNINDLQNLDSKRHIATIGSTVGKLKRTQIVLEADELNILVSNPGKIQLEEEKVPLPEIPEDEEEISGEGEEVEGSDEELSGNEIEDEK